MGFECAICSTQCTTKEILARHLRAVHRNDAEKFSCPECDKTFNRRDILKRHSLTHSKRIKLTQSPSQLMTSATVEQPDYLLENRPSTTVHRCEECLKTFDRGDMLKRHALTHSKRMNIDSTQSSSKPAEVPEASPQPALRCMKCNKTFQRRDKLTRHMLMHRSDHITCNDCGGTVSRADKLVHHQKFVCPATRERIASIPLDAAAPSTSTPSDNIITSDEEEVIGDFTKTERAFKSRLVTYELRRNFSRKFTLQLFLTFVFDHVVNLLQKVLQSYKCVKINIFLECEFTNCKGETCLKNFKTNNYPLFQTTDLDILCSSLFDKLMREKDKCDFKGSGWSFVKVKKFEIRVNKYNPLKGAAYIPLPRKLDGIVNVYNSDSFCFKYCILAKFVQGDARFPSSYTPELENKYNWQSVEFPVKLNNIPKFEKDNDISINVFGLDKDNKLYPLKVCDKTLPDHRDLILLTNKNSDTHYVYISDFDKLISAQLTKRNHRIHVCKRCFAYFDNQPNKLGLKGAERLIEHERYCFTKTPLRLDLSPDPTIAFKNTERSQRVRFAVYADFECALIPKDPVNTDSDSITHDHVPHSYCYLIKDSQSSSTPVIRQYRGSDAAKHFVESIKTDVLSIGDILYGERQMAPSLTPADEAAHFAADLCHICGQGFSSDKDPKVRDHMHSHPYSYRGAAHSSCNLRHQEQNTVNCYFHNLSYDSHFIIKELGYDEKDIFVIANSEEKYISFTKYIPYKKANRGNLKLRFVDTLRFLPSSLSKLADNLPHERFTETKRKFPDTEQFNLLTRKGVFPYSYISSLEKLNEPQLPPRPAFYNKLTLESVSDEDFKHAEDVWKAFSIKDLGQYSDWYLLTDVVLLTDIFEHFRDASLKSHQLDPAYYITLPSYSWDCMLKNTNVTLETIQDHDIYLFFEKGIRGGISQCMKRKSRANNMHCAGYDASRRSKYIAYLDANNLYGWSQSQRLPTGNFKWLSTEEIDNLNVESVSNDSDVGYVLEVDIEYPKSLHRKHQDLPFLCERKTAPNTKHSKLLTTLEDKQNYIVHYRVLKQALKHGLVLKKVHRVVSFDQSPWLKPYIDLNTNLRKAAKNDFEKDLFKLYVNSVFGKTMENMRKRMNYKLACNEKKVEKLISKPNFLSRTIFSESLVGVNLAKESIVLEKPLYVGMCILELSKVLMYEFYYDVVLPYYGAGNVRLLYMDTDSLIIEILTPDLYNSFVPILDHLDTSGLPVTNPAYRPDNAKVIGKFKDELNGVYIQEFLGVRTKVYCIVKEDDERKGTIKRCKGITKPVVAKSLQAEDYRKCIEENGDWYTMNTTFRSYKHNVVTRWENKLTLSCYDFKRYLLPDGVSTLPYGHPDIE